jgi:4-hydroxybenzoate polyprenyltransferase
MARSVSTNNLIVSYIAQRARFQALLPLSVAIAAVAWTGVGMNAFQLPEFVATVAQSLLLVFAFRVWDDIEDRHRDAVHHPERVLASSSRVTPFIIFAAALAAAGMIPAVLIARLAQQLAIINLAIVVLIIWYHRRATDAPTLANAHIVLLKYPVIAFAVAPIRPRLPALVALYLGLCAFEVFDDPALRASSNARRVAVAEAFVGAIALAVGILYGGILL